MTMIDDQLAERIKDLNWSPLMEWREFADWVRVDQGVVEGWVKRAYIPTHKIGCHRMVDIPSVYWNRGRKGELYLLSDPASQV